MPEHERENYYILLELESDPPVTDSGRIKSALRAKKQEWTRWQDIPGKRNAGLSYLGMAQDIEKTLLDPVLRDKEAAAAREEKREMLSQFEAELRVIESKGYILPREAAAIAVKYKAYGVKPESVPEHAKCPVTEEPPQKDEDNGEILDKLTAKNVQRNLKILGFPTLYAFLGEPPYSSVKKLLAAAEQKRRTASNQGTKSSQAIVSQELAGICVSMFESIQSKQKYDRYIKVSRYPAVSELIDEEYARSQYISPEVLLRIVNFAVEKYGAKILEAEEYIKNYCNSYDIPLDARGVRVKCPACGNKTPRGGTVCSVCAQPLSGGCPACGEPFADGPAICASCGFSIKDMGKALRNLSDAETALIENNWSTAQRNLQYVRMYWPNHPKLELLEKRAALLEERYASYVEQVEDCIKHRQLYAAKELIDEAAARHLRLPQQRIKYVAEQLAAFEYRLEKLPLSGEPDIEKLLHLSADVTDSIELGRLLAAYPPEPPSSVSTIPAGNYVNVTWGLSASAESYAVTYFLVRKKGSAPLTAFDGDLLYEGPANSFEDKSPDPLTKYYYCVFAKRAGTYSRTGLCSEPVLIVPEIEGLRILPMDGGAQLKWRFSSDVREILVWRKLGGDAPVESGDGILLENDRLDGFTDIKLKNEVEYWYYIVAAYVVDGVRMYSKGVCDSVVPRKMVAPPDDLNISATDTESVYIVNWNSTQHPDILLFCASKKPGFRTGDIIAVEELMDLYRKIDLDYKRVNSAQFKLSVSGGMYIFAAVVFGRFATVCEPRYLVNVADVENPVCEDVGGSLYVDMKWPVGVTDVALSYRFDRYPQSPEEPGATTLYRTRAQYDVDAAIILKDPERDVYHMTVFAAFTMPDGKKAYSKGVQLVFNNRPLQEVLYSFTYKKKRFSAGAGTLDVTLTSDEDFTLPKAVIVGKIGRLPLSRADGLPLFEIEKEMRVSGSLSLQYTTSPFPPNLYIRMFLRDDSMYEKFSLFPSSPVKIT